MSVEFKGEVYVGDVNMSVFGILVLFIIIRLEEIIQIVVGYRKILSFRIFLMFRDLGDKEGIVKEV